MKKRNKDGERENIWIHIFFIIACLVCLLPFLLLLSVSLSSEEDIIQYGYSLWPRNFDFSAYEFILKDPSQVISAYQVTIFSSVVGTALSVFVMALLAYSISRKNFSYRRAISFIVFFTMLFSGGLVPSYILNTHYLHLKDNIWVYSLPSLVNGFYVFMLRTFFAGLPTELYESAKIDGANEMRCFFRIALPLSKPAIATVSLLVLLIKWNDWFTAMLYIEKQELVSLQYLLQRIMQNIELIRQNQELFSAVGESVELPNESLRMAMAIVCAGPVLLVFPFFQKYFVKGLTIGAVKG